MLLNIKSEKGRGTVWINICELSCLSIPSVLCFCKAFFCITSVNMYELITQLEWMCFWSHLPAWERECRRIRSKWPKYCGDWKEEGEQKPKKTPTQMEIAEGKADNEHPCFDCWMVLWSCRRVCRKDVICTGRMWKKVELVCWKTSRKHVSSLEGSSYSTFSANGSVY